MSDFCTHTYEPSDSCSVAEAVVGFAKKHCFSKISFRSLSEQLQARWSKGSISTGITPSFVLDTNQGGVSRRFIQAQAQAVHTGAGICTVSAGAGADDRHLLLWAECSALQAICAPAVAECKKYQHNPLDAIFIRSFSHCCDVCTVLVRILPPPAV